MSLGTSPGHRPGEVSEERCQRHRKSSRIARWAISQGGVAPLDPPALTKDMSSEPLRSLCACVVLARKASTPQRGGAEPPCGLRAPQAVDPCAAPRTCPWRTLFRLRRRPPLAADSGAEGRKGLGRDFPLGKSPTLRGFGGGVCSPDTLEFGGGRSGRTPNSVVCSSLSNLPASQTSPIAPESLHINVQRSD